MNDMAASVVQDSLENIVVPFARVDCSGNELAYLKEVLESGWLTTAQKAHDLEARFASHLGAKHALAVNSCTSAMHLALEALGVRQGDKVLVPTMTFTATVEVIRYLQAVPVFMDVDPATSLVSESIVQNALDQHPDAKALIVVHYGGQAAPMVNDAGEGIVSLCAQRNVAIVEDAAHAFPTRLKDRFVGTFGDVMAVTNSDVLAERMRTMRLHGIDRDVWQRYTGTRNNWEYDVVAPGFKYNMPDLNAAVALAQLERADDARESRMQCAKRYWNWFENHPLFRPLDRVSTWEEHSWHLFPIILTAGVQHKRNEFIEMLAKSGIGVSVHYKPIHRLSYYRDTFQVKDVDYPGAEALWNSTISLPIYASLTSEEQQSVIEAVISTADALNARF